MTQVARQSPVSPDEIFAALEQTWPPAAWHATQGWRIAEGRGGGQRVSAGRAIGPDADPIELERAQAALGQRALAMVRPGEEELDRHLERHGYATIDPTRALAAPVGLVSSDPPPVTVFDVQWPPLTIQTEIWGAAGIGASRIDVMSRTIGPRTTLMGRKNDVPCATAFVACHGRVAMVHALEVVPSFQRQGMGRHMMAVAASWASDQGADVLVVLVTEANLAANALYTHLGLREVTGYHYRGKGGNHG